MEKSMKALNELDPFLQFMGVYNKENFRGNRHAVLRHFCRIVDVSISLVLFATLVVMVFWYAKDDNYRISSPIIPTFINAFQTLISCISLMTKNRKMGAAIDHLRSIIAQSDSISLKSIEAYAQIERKHAFITRILFIALALTCGVVFALTAMQPVSYLILGSPKPEQWKLPIGAHALLGLDNYIGFYTGLIIQILSARVQIHFLIASASFHLGICMYLNGMIGYLHEQIADMNYEIRGKRIDYAEFPRKFIKQIDFHNAILKLVGLDQQALSAVIFGQLLVCAVITALSLFSLQSNNFLSTDTIVSVYELLIVVVMAFIYCHLSDLATSYLLDVGASVYGCDWFMLPVRQQKLIILSIQRSQNEFYFNGLGMVDCTLRTFFSINKTAISYFIVIRDIK